eukprot:TRINITY_DN795_c0_g1_i2.p1 TRINITY_DN795_c0_g1~~TRINITY_DN795_c0_g1_i2.p1  ORF type:complete len:473 (+),score=84.74 TRINITY_DN795_c0_g1_i2:186-1604(+)
MQRASNLTNPRYYRVLRLSPKATDVDIRRAYRRLAILYHPDKAGEAGEEMFKEVSEAYSVLSNPKKRRLYDRLGDEGFAMFQQMSSGDDDDADLFSPRTIATFACAFITIVVCLALFPILLAIKVDRHKDQWPWAAVFVPVWIMSVFFLIHFSLELLRVVRRYIREGDRPSTGFAAGAADSPSATEPDAPPQKPRPTARDVASAAFFTLAVYTGVAANACVCVALETHCVIRECRAPHGDSFTGFPYIVAGILYALCVVASLMVRVTDRRLSRAAWVASARFAVATDDDDDAAAAAVGVVPKVPYWWWIVSKLVPPVLGSVQFVLGALRLDGAISGQWVVIFIPLLIIVFLPVTAAIADRVCCRMQHVGTLGVVVSVAGVLCAALLPGTMVVLLVIKAQTGGVPLSAVLAPVFLVTGLMLLCACVCACLLTCTAVLSAVGAPDVDAEGMPGHGEEQTDSTRFVATSARFVVR